MSRTALRVLASSLWAGLAACGDDGGTGAADTVSDSQVADTQVADTAPADTQVADTAPADTQVVDTAPADTGQPGLSSLAIQFVQTFDGPSVSDVSVAWIPPGGERIETTTDGDGKVTFRDIDWSKGSISFVGRKPNFVVHGAVMTKAALEDPAIIRNDDGDVLFLMEPLARATTIEVSGKAVGMASEALNLVVSTDVNAFTFGRGSSFALDVLPDTPFNWSAYVWGPNGDWDGRNIDNVLHAWAAGTSPGGAADYTMAIDFVADAMPVTKVSGTFPLFASDDTTLDEMGTARVSVFSRDEPGAAFIGGVSRAIVTEGNAAVDYDVEWIEPDWVTSPFVVYDLGTNSESSSQIVAGWPTAGNQDIRLPVPATWPTLGSVSIADALTWTNAEPDLFATVLVGAGPTSRVVAVFNLPFGSTELTIPELPGGVDLFEHSGEAVLGANVVLCGFDLAVSHGLCARYATSKRRPLSH